MQTKRGGGSVCHQSKPIADSYRTLVVDFEPCSTNNNTESNAWIAMNLSIECTYCKWTKYKLVSSTYWLIKCVYLLFNQVFGIKCTTPIFCDRFTWIINWTEVTNCENKCNKSWNFNRNKVLIKRNWIVYISILN